MAAASGTSLNRNVPGEGLWGRDCRPEVKCLPSMHKTMGPAPEWARAHRSGYQNLWRCEDATTSVFPGCPCSQGSDSVPLFYGLSLSQAGGSLLKLGRREAFWVWLMGRDWELRSKGSFYSSPALTSHSEPALQAPHVSSPSACIGTHSKNQFVSC